MAKPRNEITNGQQLPSSDKRRKKRISVYLNDDGMPDWSGVPDDQRELLGGKLPEAAPPSEPIAPEMVGLLLRAVTAIEGAVLARTMDLPAADVHAALTIPQPIERPLCEVGARVLEKHFSGSSKYQDEIVLASLLLTWQGSAIAQLRAMRAESKPIPCVDPRPEPIEQRESRTTEPEPEPARPSFISDEERLVLTPIPAEV